MLFNEFLAPGAHHEHLEHKITSLDENKAHNLINKDQRDDLVNIKAIKIHL